MKKSLFPKKNSIQLLKEKKRSLFKKRETKKNKVSIFGGPGSGRYPKGSGENPQAEEREKKEKDDAIEKVRGYNDTNRFYHRDQVVNALKSTTHTGNMSYDEIADTLMKFTVKRDFGENIGNRISNELADTEEYLDENDLPRKDFDDLKIDWNGETYYVSGSISVEESFDEDLHNGTYYTPSDIVTIHPEEDVDITKFYKDGAKKDDYWEGNLSFQSYAVID